MLTALWFLLFLQGSTLEQAREMTAAEVKFSRIAENRAHLDRVRDFAKMLDRDQTQNSIEGAREKTGPDTTAIMPLNKHDEKKVDQLSRLSGEEFDRAYIDAIIRNQEQAIQLLEGLTDQYDIPQAQAMLPDLHKHLQEAKAIKEYLRGPQSYVRDR